MNTSEAINKVVREHAVSINTILSKTFKIPITAAAGSWSWSLHGDTFHGKLHFQAEVGGRVDPVHLFRILRGYCDANDIIDPEKGWPSERKIRKYAKSGMTPRFLFSVKIPRKKVKALAKLEEL